LLVVLGTHSHVYAYISIIYLVFVGFSSKQALIPLHFS
jgi:hypothetical protein